MLLFYFYSFGLSISFQLLLASEQCGQIDEFDAQRRLFRGRGDLDISSTQKCVAWAAYVWPLSLKFVDDKHIKKSGFFPLPGLTHFQKARTADRWRYVLHSNTQTSARARHQSKYRVRERKKFEANNFYIAPTISHDFMCMNKIKIFIRQMLIIGDSTQTTQPSRQKNNS